LKLDPGKRARQEGRFLSFEEAVRWCGEPDGWAA